MQNILPSKIVRFLQKEKISFYNFKLLEQDASQRKYYRIFLKNSTMQYIVMDCPVTYISIMPFVHIAEFLYAYNISVPYIFAIDEAEGLLLLEDFGDLTISKLLNRINPKTIPALYKEMIKPIVVIQNLPKNLDLEVQNFDENTIKIGCKYFINHYVKELNPRYELNILLLEYTKILTNMFNSLPKIKTILLLKDYHISNIMYLSDRTDIRKFGLLDFQDASFGSPAFDLVCLIQDARFDLDLEYEDTFIDYFLSINPTWYNKEEFKHHYYILGTHRSLLLLGIFMKKYKQDHQAYYLKFIPRVKKCLKHNFNNYGYLLELKNWLIDNNLFDYVCN